MNKGNISEDPLLQKENGENYNDDHLTQDQSQSNNKGQKDNFEYENESGSFSKVIPTGVQNYRIEELKDPEEDGNSGFRKTGGRFTQGLRNKTISQAGLIVVLICLISCNFGAYASFDTHQLLEDYFLLHFDIEPKRVVQMYTVFNAFAVPTGLVTGFIIAWFSPLLACLCCCFLVLVASVVSAYGIATKNFIWMIIGKAFCGFGSEATEIAQYTLISIWFQGKFLSIAGGLGQFANYLAVTVSMLFTSGIFESSRNMLTVYSIVGYLCGFSVLALIVFAYFDLKYGKPTTVQQGGSSVAHEGQKVDCSTWKFLNTKLAWFSIINPWFSQQIYFGFSAWMTNLLTKRFKYDLADSTYFQALMPVSIMIGIPIWSTIALKQGKKLTLMISGYLVVAFCFLSMYLMPERQSIIVGVPLFLIGQFLAIESSCTWTSVCLASHAKCTPLAIGLVQFGSAGLGAILATIFSLVLNEQKVANFNRALLIMVVFSLMGATIGYLNYLEDCRTGGMLEYPENSNEVKILKQMIDRGELLPLVQEYEEKYKKDPKCNKKVRIELKRKIKFMAQKLRETVINSETGEPIAKT